MWRQPSSLPTTLPDIWRRTVLVIHLRHPHPRSTLRTGRRHPDDSSTRARSCSPSTTSCGSPSQLRGVHVKALGRRTTARGPERSASLSSCERPPNGSSEPTAVRVLSLISRSILLPDAGRTQGDPAAVRQEHEPAVLLKDGLVAHRYRHLTRVSDSAFDLDESHLASHGNHVPIIPVVCSSRRGFAE